MSSLRDALVQELLQFATPDLKRRHFDEGKEESIPYEESCGGFIYHKETTTRITTVSLTNFIAYIIRDTEEDDDADTERALAIRAKIAGVVRRFDVSGSRFQSMQWVLEYLGTKAVVYPGAAAEAIWHRLKTEARADFESGGIAAKIFETTEWRRDPWRRAQ